MLDISAFNEFKDAKTISEMFIIDQSMIDEFLDFDSSANPALAGFMLQSRYFENVQKMTMKLAEIYFADGLVGSGYSPSDGGAYGILSDSILLALADSASESPTLATAQDWAQNPTKLVQKISNFYYKPADKNNPLPASASSLDIYKDILRLLNLAAVNNVRFGKKWKLFVPASFFASANSIAIKTETGSGTTINNVTTTIQKILSELNGGVIDNLEVVVSSLNDARTTSSGSAQVNLFVLIASDAPIDKKPVILPQLSSAPLIVNTATAPDQITFRSNFVTGGAMVLQYGGAYVLSFDQEE